MNVTDNIKRIRIQKGLRQNEVYPVLGISKSVYSKIESGGRDATIQELVGLSKLFDMTLDQIVFYEGNLPTPVIIEDKPINEQHQLFDELDEEDRQTVLKIVDKMLTTKKFNDFIQANANK